MFCPRSTTWTPGRTSVTETGRSSSTADTGGAGEQTRASYPRSLTATGDHSGFDRQEPAVLLLALDQVDLGDVRGGPAPGRIGADDGGRAVLVLEVHLRQEGRLGAPLVVGVEHADLAAVPAVGQQRLDHVGAGRQHGRHVVGLDLGVGGVLRVAGRELVAADTLPVDGRLVDPVRGRVEAGPDDGLVDDDLAPQQVRRPVPRRSAVGAGGDPGGRPVLGVEQPGLHDKRLGPLAETGLGLDANPHLPAFARRQRLARPRHQHVGVALDADARAVVDLDLVGELAAGARRQPPREPRLPLADTEGAVEVFCA